MNKCVCQQKWVEVTIIPTTRDTAKERELNAKPVGKIIDCLMRKKYKTLQISGISHRATPRW